MVSQLKSIVPSSVKRFLKGRDKKEVELDRIKSYPRFTKGETTIFGKPFIFHETQCFLDTYEEIFANEIYKFNPSTTKRTILDCGANMGLSVVYFAYNYPDHHIIAFEPDEELFEILEKNIKSLGIDNVTLHKKAVWDKHEILKFYTDGGMGGRVNSSYTGKTCTEVEAVPLKEFLSNDIDFLKLDIEGAEDVVLTACKNELSKVDNIFFEYHSKINSPQTLQNLFQIVNDNNFRYYIKESATRKRPFVDTNLICECYDMAINIFCYKELSLTA